MAKDWTEDEKYNNTLKFIGIVAALNAFFTGFVGILIIHVIENI